MRLPIVLWPSPAGVTVFSYKAITLKSWKQQCWPDGSGAPNPFRLLNLNLSYMGRRALQRRLMRMGKAIEGGD